MKKILYSMFFVALLIYSVSSFAFSLTVNQDINTFVNETQGLRPQVLKLALKSYNCALQKDIKDNKKILTIIDYSLPSGAKRLWVLDLKNQKVLFNTLVAHGKFSGNGGGEAVRFSDQPHSLESSIGLFVTEGTYFGHDGFSLIIRGLEKGFNDEAEQRHVIIHGAWYVSRDMIKRYGVIGRSWGCPALDEKIVKPIIDTIKDNTILFAYYPNPKWLMTSAYINCKE